MELGRLFGFLHPALIHFPLVLLLVSFVLELLGFARHDVRFASTAKWALILGAVAILFAFVCGNFAEIWAARDGVPQAPMELHELYATVTSWMFVFLTAGRLLLRVESSRRWTAVYLSCMAIACVLLVITGHKGAMLVYHQGAGVQLGTTLPLPTHEDLAVLRQKQDPDALFYSNNMHHVFGVMVLIFSALLLVEMAWPSLAVRLRKVTPLLLLAGGIFLFVFSDTDSWPLSHQRPITDKEVLMHKTYALLMLAFGAAGFTRRRLRDPLRGLETGTIRSADFGDGVQRQGRLMAAFSLVGGALLFTHVHSNAPYANVAVGVYIHHTVMGFIALCIGGVKLFSEYVTGSPMRRIALALAWAYPCLMLTESIFLLNYNEGLPWFLGYRNLSLTAPHGGLVAPLGNERAEFVYDPLKLRLDVYLLHQSDNRPFPVAAGEIQAVIRVGTESTSVSLSACAESAGNFHFAGRATFLRGISMFQARALVDDARSAPNGTLLADFEPWTDSRAANAEHSLAAFICPMHRAVGAGAPGYCSVCGMTLVPNKAARPWDRLHDDSYRMDFVMSAQMPIGQPSSVVVASAGKVHLGNAIRFANRPASFGINPTHGQAESNPLQLTPSVVPSKLRRREVVTSPNAGRHVQLKLTARREDGSVITSLAVVHTRKLHLIIASKDLSFFDHVHPEQQTDGSLILEYAFPAPGEYTLYADFTPTGDRNQVFAIPVTVSGAPAVALPLQATPAQARTFGDYRVRLDYSPEPPQPGDETQLTFNVSLNGVPVTDIEPYLGAGGHCVALSEDGRAYLHSHPLEMSGARFGPTITFHTLFPVRGLYKIWGQFKHRGRLLIADFVVRVP